MSKKGRRQKLKKGHSWKAKPGYKIFVADRGAARFDYPQRWIMKFDSDSIKFYDKQPPADDCTLAFSYRRFPPVDWKQLPVADLLRGVVAGDERPVFHMDEPISVLRDALTLAWMEFRFMDPRERREARSRISLAFAPDHAFGGCLQGLLTLDYWPEDAARLGPIWDEVLHSLELGAYIDDPTQGKIMN